MKYIIGFKGKRLGWQYWSGRAWTDNKAQAKKMTDAEIEAFIRDHPSIDSSRIEKFEVK